MTKMNTNTQHTGNARVSPPNRGYDVALKRGAHMPAEPDGSRGLRSYDVALRLRAQQAGAR
jgi:hypothetical protein